MEINHLFNNNLKQYSSYNNIRTISCFTDGLKNSSRKIIWFSKDIKGYVKVSSHKSYIAMQSQYLHNEDILPDVMIDFARDFSNHIPLFTPLSAVGSRTKPSASSPRYSNIKKSKYFDLLFNKDDEEILVKQFFEGVEIEPKFLVPTLPLILINGSNGIGTGFYQNIFPRNPIDVINVIKKHIKGENIDDIDIKPDFKGYKGEIELVSKEHNKKQWLFRGIYKKASNGKYLEILEVTPKVTNEDMLKHLNNLKDKKVIKDYKDKSLGDNFHYIVNLYPDFFEVNKDKNIYKILGIETTEVETFTCATKDNFIKVYKDEIEILKDYIDVKLKSIELRKDNILNKLKQDYDFLCARIKFIALIVKKQLDVSNRKKAEISEDMITKFSFNKDYIDSLLSTPIYLLTNEKILDLLKQKENLEKKIKEIDEKTYVGMWGEDIIEFLKVFKENSSAK